VHQRVDLAQAALAAGLCLLLLLLLGLQLLRYLRTIRQVRTHKIVTGVLNVQAIGDALYAGSSLCCSSLPQRSTWSSLKHSWHGLVTQVGDRAATCSV
jgi:hypothetical protein